MGKEYLKKDANELQEYLMFRRRGSRVEAKKGKGAVYKRSREKNKARKQENEWINKVVWEVTSMVQCESCASLNRECEASGDISPLTFISGSSSVWLERVVWADEAARSSRVYRAS